MQQQQDKIFAEFPGDAPGIRYIIDVMTIEAIGQSDVREVAIIYPIGADRYYRVVVDAEALDEGMYRDAAGYALAIMSNAVQKAAGLVDPEPPTEPALFHGGSSLPL